MRYVLKPSPIMALKEMFYILISIMAFIYVNFFSYTLTKYIPLEIMRYLAYGLLSAIVITIIALIWKIITLRTTVFTITSEIIELRRGIFSKHSDVMEMYRIKDYQIHEPFWMRIFKLGKIVLYTSDKTHPIFEIPGIRQSNKIYEELREAVERKRRNTGTREID